MCVPFLILQQYKLLYLQLIQNNIYLLHMYHAKVIESDKKTCSRTCVSSGTRCRDNSFVPALAFLRGVGIFGDLLAPGIVRRHQFGLET
jgi:hypothetical protein